MSAIIALAFCCAIVPAALWVWNMLLYREPGSGSCAEMGHCVLPDAISVLIPARNEERVIAASLSSLLASRGVAIEIIVLDDGSTDRTAEIVREIALKDARVRLRSSPRLPGGWNGKQHACHALAKAARSNILCFLDADVRLAPDALVSMSAFLVRSGSDLVSGFPRQETETPLEWLLLPLIHFVLLSYLPLAGMRALGLPGFAAGCGQFLMVRRDAYRKTSAVTGCAQILPILPISPLAACITTPQRFGAAWQRMLPRAWRRRLVSCLSPCCSFVGRSFPFCSRCHWLSLPHRMAHMRARSYLQHWPRLLCPACFPSGNIVNPCSALCCIHSG
jgi:hypothetical protein